MNNELPLEQQTNNDKMLIDIPSAQMPQNPMLGEDAVNLVSLFGYWHLHRSINNRHFFGFSDHRIGLSVREEPKEAVKDWTPREPKKFISFTTKEGKLIEYWDEPYTESQIQSFSKLTLEDLERWVKRGT